jgi:hypothetical protein
MKKAPAEEKEKILDAVAGKSSRETDRELAKIDPKTAREFTRWINENEVQITFSLEKPAFQSMDELKNLRAHKDVQKTYRVLVTDLVQLGHEKWNLARRNATSTLKSHCESGKSIPAGIRREVWNRDGGACSFRVPGSDGVCGSRELVQIDHIKPVALGGTNEASNLRLLCAPHNRDRARKTFGSP